MEKKPTLIFLITSKNLEQNVSETSEKKLEETNEFQREKEFKKAKLKNKKEEIKQTIKNKIEAYKRKECVSILSTFRKKDMRKRKNIEANKEIRNPMINVKNC